MKRIIANWKMYKTIEESLHYIQALTSLLQENEDPIYLAVPFTAIQPLAFATKKSYIVIGAQNMNDAEEGAFTGEIAARMLTEVGARFVILGHSERRRYFQETDAFINRKIQRALTDGLQPIFCIGESQIEREEGRTEKVLRRQIKEGLAEIAAEQAEDLILAYEPIWAVGSSHPATPEIIEEAHQICRKTLQDLFGNEAAKIEILYGGSVTPQNTPELISQPSIDGLLVGGASLSPETFAKIVLLAQNRKINISSGSS